MSSDTVRPQPANDRDVLPTCANSDRIRQFVRELPVPVELASVIETFCKERRIVRGYRRDLLEENLKLQYYYGGKIVAVMQTDRGLMVLAVGDSLDSPEIAGLRDSLTPEENARAVLDSIPPWDDDTSRL